MRPAVAAGKMAPCVSCHEPHGTAEADDETLKASCAKCHAADSEEAQLAGKLADELASARQAYAQIKAIAGLGAGDGLTANRVQIAVDQARTALLQAAVAQHSAQFTEVDRYTAPVRSALVELEQARKDQVERLRVRQVVLIYIWGFLLASVAAMWARRQRAWRQWQATRGDGGAAA